MSAYRKFQAFWAVPLPLGADAPDGPVDVNSAIFDEFDKADWFARFYAKKGPMPDWWAVQELKRHPARSVCRNDRWSIGDKWQSGQAVAHIERPDFAFIGGRP